LNEHIANPEINTAKKMIDNPMYFQNPNGIVLDTENFEIMQKNLPFSRYKALSKCQNQLELLDYQK
jgi:hypothetical protein